MLNSFEWAMWIITVLFISLLLHFFINRKLNSSINQFEDVWREIKDIKEQLRNVLQNKHEAIHKEIMPPAPKVSNLLPAKRKYSKKSKK